MAISFDAASTSTQGSDTNTWNHVLGAGSDRKVIVGCHAEDGSDSDTVVASVTYNAVAMTKIDGSEIVHRPAGSSNRTTMFYMDEASLPAAGTHEIIVTFESGTASSWGGAVSLFGAASGAPEVDETGTSTQTGITTTITTLTANALLVDCVGYGNSTGAPVVDETGQVLRVELAGANIDALMSTRPIVSAGATQMSYKSGGGARIAHAILSIAPSATNLVALGFATGGEEGAALRTALIASGEAPAGTMAMLGSFNASGARGLGNGRKEALGL